MGFWRSDFSGHPEKSEAFEPPHHLTLKTPTAREFRALFRSLLARVRLGREMTGYLEGEYVVVDRDIAPRPFDASVHPPFKLCTASLPPGHFRESEIHICLNKDQSQPALLTVLADMGLFSAYLPKPYGTARIFTAQGSQKVIASILGPLTDYLARAGGSAGLPSQGGTDGPPRRLRGRIGPWRLQRAVRLTTFGSEALLVRGGSRTAGRCLSADVRTIVASGALLSRGPSRMAGRFFSLA